MAPDVMAGYISRVLEDNDEVQSYLVDSEGNAYEPYSLAWRYLGMFIDCDITTAEEVASDSSAFDTVYRRRLESGDDEEAACSRKVLWAAYRDPGYNDGSIGEYQFYDWQKGVWDESTCQTKRCARMDCHEPSTHFQLIGVFKETDGLVDWAEQLFKHQGYCLWKNMEDDNIDENEGGDGGDDDNDNDGDSIYGFMDGLRQYWPSGCTQLYLSDSDGNTLYLDTMPQKEGNITYGLYLDEDCSKETTMTFPQYVQNYFETYYGYEAQNALKSAAYWSTRLRTWNEWMTSYKICNPCRAYSRVPTTSNDDEDDRRRFLNEGNEEDGEGDEEQFGYNCYDDAGYTNCNQCYKFETKTDLEPATTEDLERASSQGSILAIKVDGKVYGEGYASLTATPRQKVTRAFVALGVIALIGLLVYLKRAWLQKLLSTRRRGIDSLKSSFGEAIFKHTDEGIVRSDEEDEPKVRTDAYEGLGGAPGNEVARLTRLLQEERTRRELECGRKDEYIKQLEDKLQSKEEALEVGLRSNVA